MTCSVDSCRSPTYCKGLCRKHYSRSYRRGNPLAGEPRFEFESRMRRTETCWIWTGTFFQSGYGRFSMGDKKLRAHRAAYTLFVGPIPTGMHVCHSCDNPACVNPAHLWLGTHVDNMRDMQAKGRAKWIQDNLRRPV